MAKGRRKQPIITREIVIETKDRTYSQKQIDQRWKLIKPGMVVAFYEQEPQIPDETFLPDVKGKSSPHERYYLVLGKKDDSVYLFGFLEDVIVSKEEIVMAFFKQHCRFISEKSDVAVQMTHLLHTFLRPSDDLLDL